MPHCKRLRFIGRLHCHWLCSDRSDFYSGMVQAIRFFKGWKNRTARGGSLPLHFWISRLSYGTRNWSFLTRFVFAFLMTASYVMACQVPVFRYALERWLTDQYEILVLHDGPIHPDGLGRLERLRTLASQDSNAVVRDVDIQESKNDGYRRLWQDKKADHASLLAVYYPQSAHEIPDRLLRVTAFDDSSIDRLLESPLRQKIAERLAKGVSAAWIFVPTGDATKDAPARKILDEELTRCQRLLVLPTLEELELKDEASREAAGKMRIAFETLTLARDDPHEIVLKSMLLRSESDLMGLDEPLAFPVFGRGRVLYALVGKGINREMIHSACQFMVGPCSCQVKAQNPGFDLLMSCDWEKSIGGVKISDPLPEEPSEPVLLKIPPGRSGK